MFNTRFIYLCRGATDLFYGQEFGSFTLGSNVAINELECLGNELLITDCTVGIGSKCNSTDDQFIGVRCHQNPYLQCALDEYLNGNACYKIISDNLDSTHQEAKSICEDEGGDLLHITSQIENDFVSELVLKFLPSVSKVHTDGIGQNIRGADSFIWEHSNTILNFTNWWPGNRNPVYTYLRSKFCLF